MDAGKRGRGRPPVITRDQIVRAARRVGLDDLRMAAVAQELGVRPAALYHHVRDRDELLHLVAWQVLEETAYDEWVPDSADWRVWLHSYAGALRTAMLEHAGVLRFIRLTTTATAGRLDQMERLVETLVAAGFDLETARHAIQYVHVLVLAEVRESAVPGGEAAPQVAEFQEALATRPPDELPLLRRMAAARDAPDPAEHFEFVLTCLIAGLEARLRR